MPYKSDRSDFTASIEHLQATHCDDNPDQHPCSLISIFARDLLTPTNIDGTVLGFRLTYLILVQDSLERKKGLKEEEFVQSLLERRRLKGDESNVDLDFYFALLSVLPSQVTSTPGEKASWLFFCLVGSRENCDFYFITHS